jgi:integrase
MAAPKGHIRKHGDGYQVVVPVGRDPVTGRYRYAYESARNLDEAKERREEMVGRIADGREPTVKATVGELLDKWLAVAELELTTRVTYEGYIERVIRPVLGGIRLRELERRVDVLDGLYAELRRCRKLCGGRKGLIDHRPPGRPPQAGQETPTGHVCDKRCRPHQCRPMEPATILQIHSILRRAFKYAVRWQWIRQNPAQLASVPRSVAQLTDPPTPAEATRLLKVAREHSPDLALFVWLVMVTGARRGELCSLRWTDIDAEDGDLLIERAYAVRQGTKVIKTTKTHQKRRLALDGGTLDLPSEHREQCAKRAEEAGGELRKDGYVFSRDGLGELPWFPDTVTKWVTTAATQAGVDATIKSLRHYNATQMLTGGIDLRTAAARLGHSSGGHITLKVYAHRTRPSDQRAAEILARGLRDASDSED